MAEDLTTTDVLNKLGLTQNDETTKEFSLSGIMPLSLANVELKKNVTILGITPEDFAKQYASIEFDFETLMKTFNVYCKDFLDDLSLKQPSKALEFSAKILFEYGPYIRSEKKGKGDKAIRFKFPYKRSDGTLSVRVVIVSTFKETFYKAMEEKSKMIITFKQAAMLSMITFSKAIV